MKLIKVAAGVLNQTPLDWDKNKANIIRAIEMARVDSVSILCLPEMCITGYGCEDAFHSPGVADTAWKILHEILPHTPNIIISVGLPIIYNNGIYNCAGLIADEKILGFVAKQYLAGDGIHYEPRWFKPWPNDVSQSLIRDGKAYPIGDIYFEVGGIKIGFEICEDAWVARRPGSDLALKGVDVILNPSASHFAFAKHHTRQRFVIEGSRSFGVSYIYTNLLGCESGRVIFDGDSLIAMDGALIANGRRFSFADVLLTGAIIDITKTRLKQWRTASLKPNVLDDMTVVAADFVYPRLDEIPTPPLPMTETSTPYPDEKEEEFARAVALGLFDYLRKSRSRGFIVSLSGGADSAAVSSLVAIMVYLGLNELGQEQFRQKLSYLTILQTSQNAQDMIYSLLTCVYQSTENSGEITRNAATQLARALGAQFYEFNVDGIVKGYIQIIENGLQRALTWDRDDIALQNIQARSRGPSVWMLANVSGALLLTTSNRSEAAVGYATMDGDTCGGLCPIGGIDKAFLRHWLVWLEKKGMPEIGPIPELKFVNEQQPTAELRPQSEGQTDETDLMPYPVLDTIERIAIRDKAMPREVFHQIKMIYKEQYSARQLGLWVIRFFRLWCYNQWKRERYAPSFHLDDENLDPKTWCRFPILSGNFHRELRELQDILDRDYPGES